MNKTVAAFLVAVVVLPLAAQKQYTTQDYSQAERWMSYNVAGLVKHTVSGVEYLPDGRIFYRDSVAAGTAYMLADPAKGTMVPAFDNEKLAATLRKSTGQAFTAKSLGVGHYAVDPMGGFMFTAADDKFHCNAGMTQCDEIKPATSSIPDHAKAPTDVSPDKTMEVFINNWNLWVRDLGTGKERQLTTDGVTDFGYATDNAGWTHSDAPIVVWSPDSKKIATFQQDQRKTGMMYTLSVTNRHPVLDAWRYPLLGDKDVTMIERVVIDVATGKVTRLAIPPDQHRSTICDDVSCAGGKGWDDVQFASDAKTLAFVSSSRDHKDAWFRVADVATGSVRTVYHEHVPTYYESGQGKVNWKYLPESNEFLWYSERSDWGQMYLYDLSTGKVKNAVTHGDGPVTEVLNVDAKTRTIYFVAMGKEPGEDPYIANYYRADFDGKNQMLLTPEVANHNVTPSPDGKTFVDIYSSLQTPATAVVRDDMGKVLLTLAHQDISKLLAAGWKPPVSFTVKARDGKTTLYGKMWTPTWFDPARDAGKKLPIIDYVYAGPYTTVCGPPSFSPSMLDDQAMADLGFVVVCINGMGNPFRSKSFHDIHASTAADTADDTTPDQVAGIRQLADRFPWIDANRVGVWGHSGGGNGTVNAMFHAPQLFKVGWAESGNHDNREYEDDWDEKWGGLEVIDADGKSNYDAQANQDFAKNLKGHLMLVHGTSDDNVPVNNTLLVVDALIKANKSFDMLMVPNEPHHYGADTPYVTRRKWDYFVKYLAGGTPPDNYEMRGSVQK